MFKRIRFFLIGVACCLAISGCGNKAVQPAADTDDVKTLLSQVMGTDDRLAEKAFFKLHELGPKATPAFRKLIANGLDAESMWHLMFLIDITKDPLAEDILIDATRHEDFRIRSLSAKALKGYKTASSKEALISLLNDQKSNVVWRAIESLGDVGSGDDALLLKSILLQGSSEYNRAAAATAIGKFRYPPSLEWLRMCVNDKALRVQCEVAKALYLFDKNEKNIGKLIPSIRNGCLSGEFLERSDCVETLGTFKDKDSIPTIVKCLKDEEWTVRKAAALSLGRIGDKSAISSLEIAKQDTMFSCSLAASIGLLELGISDEEPRIISALSDGDDELFAIESLKRLGTEACVSAMEELKNHENPEVREAAALALKVIKARIAKKLENGGGGGN